MGRLCELANISKVTERKLLEVGIDSPEQLKEIGSKEAFLRIRAIDPTACIHMLYGLEGAVQGTRDKFLSPEVKENLKSFFRSL
ncbi:MAG: TfoX/Sxy family protein [Clostridia bacterium]|nr:TfoX/Sxy family protein [Clostridia bacterium]